MCICMSWFEHAHVHVQMHVHVYMHIYMYMHIQVYVWIDADVAEHLLLPLLPLPSVYRLFVLLLDSVGCILGRTALKLKTRALELSRVLEYYCLPCTVECVFTYWQSTIYPSPPPFYPACSFNANSNCRTFHSIPSYFLGVASHAYKFQADLTWNFLFCQGL